MKTFVDIFIIVGAFAGIIGFIISIISLTQKEKSNKNKLENLMYILLINLCKNILTHDAELLLCLLYKEYLHRRKFRVKKTESKFFKNAGFVYNDIIPECLYDDIKEAFHELERTCFINCTFDFDNKAYNITLTDHAIIYMENRFKKNSDALLSHIKKLIKILIEIAEIGMKITYN